MLNFFKIIAIGSFCALSWGCISSHIEVQPEPVGTMNSCRLNPPMDVAFRVVREESFAYKAKVEADPNDSAAARERDLKNRIESVFSGWILANPGLSLKKDADRTIVLRISLTDLRSKDKDTTQLSVVLSCLTLFVFPMYANSPESVQVEYYDRNELVQKDSYPYERTDYLSWFMIPWNIVVTSNSPNWGVTDKTIDVPAVMQPYHRSIQINTHNALCAMQARRPMDHKNDDSTDQSDPGGSLEGGVD
ncbi:MAG: hypothetical protein KDK37_00770 [Leptospiraceae bacterium]|nr:hypothetical protein [Leptospiraceae bacterium]MCB1302776.1 hypothetical protein [Leptospiraceae bacterium]